jgi:transposase
MLAGSVRAMRGFDEQTSALFSYVSCEARVPADHPLRLIRAVVDEALDVLSPEFDRVYARVGRPGIAPEKLLRALLLQAFYSVRSERQLMEQLDYNLLSAALQKRVYPARPLLSVDSFGGV